MEEVTAVPCYGGCGLKIVRHSVWEGLTREARKDLMAAGVRRTESLGRCFKCARAGKPGNPEMGTGRHGNHRRKITPEVKARIPEIWESVVAEGGATREFGMRLGVTRERARQIVNELGLKRKHTNKERAEVFLEELEHLAGFGLGVYEISQRLGLTPDDLVARVAYLRVQRKTDLRFDQWNFREGIAA